MRKTMRFSLLMGIVVLAFSVQLVKAYENTEHGFSISFPSGWEETESDDVVVLYTNNVGSASIDVIVEETTSSLAEYTVDLKNQLKNLDYYELISERSRTIGGQNGYELVFAWTLFTGDGDSYDLQDKQFYFIQNGKAYLITCTADYSDYESFLPTFEQSIESFRLSSSGTFGVPDLTLIIIVVVIIVAVVLVISVVLLRRRRKPTQTQVSTPDTGALYPPPPPPPPP